MNEVIKIYTNALDVSKYELKNMTEIERVD